MVLVQLAASSLATKLCRERLKDTIYRCVQDVEATQTLSAEGSWKNPPFTLERRDSAA